MVPQPITANRGDELIVMAYRQEERFSGAKVAFATHDNRLRDTLDYPATEEIVHDPAQGT
jgi:hypothetical protein